MRFLGRKREFSEDDLYQPGEQLLPAVQLDYCGYGADLEVRLLSVSNGSYANPQKSNRPLQESASEPPVPIFEPILYQGTVTIGFETCGATPLPF